MVTGEHLSFLIRAALPPPLNPPPGLEGYHVAQQDITFQASDLGPAIFRHHRHDRRFDVLISDTAGAEHAIMETTLSVFRGRG
jgi:hypothetical protein